MVNKTITQHKIVVLRFLTWQRSKAPLPVRFYLEAMWQSHVVSLKKLVFIFIIATGLCSNAIIKKTKMTLFQRCPVGAVEAVEAVGAVGAVGALRLRRNPASLMRKERRLKTNPKFKEERF